MNDPSSNTDLLSRTRGLLLGAAIGDALGWPQEQRSGIVGGNKARHVESRLEFRSWVRWGGTQFSRYEDPVAAGEYSDDTQLLLATARACMHGVDWFSWLTGVELPAWPIYQRGGGRAVLKASHSWEAGKSPWEQDQDSTRSYFAAGANGVAMRIAPHVLVTINDADPTTLMERVVKDGIATHGHTRALLGGVVHALALRYTMRRSGTMEYGDLVNELIDQPQWADAARVRAQLSSEWLQKFEEFSDCTFDDSWNSTAKEMEHLLLIGRDSLQRAALADDEKTLGAIGCFDKRVNGSGTVSAAAACYLAARFAAKPSMGLLRSAFLMDADTDTLASMTGSLLGALHGPGWLISSLRNIQDYKYLNEMAEALSRTRGHAEPARKEPHRVDRKRWVRALGNGNSPTSFVDGRSIAKIEAADLQVSAKYTYTRYSIALSDGQTMIVDRRRVGPPAQSKEAFKGGEQLEVPQTRTQTQTKGDATRVAIHVADLRKTRDFYVDVLGVPVTVSDQAVHVTSWLAFVQHPEMPGRLTSGPVQITVSSPDTSRVRRRVESFKVPVVPRGPRDVDGALRVIDPDGNEVLIWPIDRPSRRP